MDTMATLRTIRSGLFGKIGKAAQSGDSRALRILQSSLETTEKLIREEEEIMRQVDALLREPTTHVVAKPKLAGNDEPHLSKREYGRRRRLRFVNEAAIQGIRLEKVASTIYVKPDGTRVGIASATESKKGGTWFLDLPKDGFDHAVLLCELNGEEMHFSLPKAFIDKYGHALSQVKDRIKFNVCKSDGAYMLSVPGHGLIGVGAYCNNYFGLD
jgi:hypothetical protein